MTGTISIAEVHHGASSPSPRPQGFYPPPESDETMGSIPSRSRRILLVDDDATIRRVVGTYLEEHSLRVVSSSQRQEATRRLFMGDVDLVLLDLVLGEENGLDVLRDIRLHSDVPVIIITGHRYEEADKVVALELGADDYVTKPFSLRELLARIRGVLRREAAGRKAAARQPESGRCRFGDWQLDRRSRRLSSPEGNSVELSKGEYKLLIAFLATPQRVLTRDYLLQATRVHEDVFDRSIDVQILRLRRKLESNPSTRQIILTERGVGYAFGLAVEWLP
jgi:two-component system, OmpR family, response regulator